MGDLLTRLWVASRDAVVGLTAVADGQPQRGATDELVACGCASFRV